jgi:type I restriction enzyme S subunit
MEKAYRIDWCSIHFDDITVSLKRGPFGSSLKKAFFVPKGYKVYEQKNAINDDNTLGDYYIDESKYDELEAFSIHPGDYIVSCSGTIGKISRLPEDTEPGIINQALLRIRIDERIIAHRFFQLLFKSMYLQSKILVDSRGTGMKNLAGVKELRKIHFFLPPLPEQRAIVSKIEQLFSDLDNGVDNFKKAQEQLKIYRQAVLKKAFEGELTKKWREEQTDLPSAKELLHQVKEEREKHNQKQLDEWKQAIKEWEDNGKEGKKPGKPKKSKELPPLTEEKISELPELSEGWCWVKVDKLLGHDPYSIKAGPFGSALKKKFYVKSGYKIYGQEQVISGNPYFGDYYIDNNKYNELFSCAIKPQDVLISLVGTVGKVLILPDNIEPGIINPRLIKISLNRSFYKTVFFKYYFESLFLKSLYKINAHGATMEIINLGIIQDLPFPFCSIQEQNQIVYEIETRLSICDKMEATIAESLQKAEYLRQSILKKAFEGKLLNEKELEEARNAPDWEPAEKLLERIKAQKNN